VAGKPMAVIAEWSVYVSGLLATEAKMRSCLSRFTRNPADTDELLQETYSRLLSVDPETVQDIRSVPAFALVAARRVAIDWLRHNRVVRIDYLDDIDDLVAPVDGPDDLVNCYQELEQLIAHVEQLPPRCSQVFILRKVFGFSQKEVGVLLGIAVDTVEQQMMKAARTLRGVFGPQRDFSIVVPFRKWQRRHSRAAML
jgi:RNA polymerase sigma factor (sigma-70 family)